MSMVALDPLTRFTAQVLATLLRPRERDGVDAVVSAAPPDDRVYRWLRRARDRQLDAKPTSFVSDVENGHDPAPTPDVLGLPRAVLVDLARRTGPAVDGCLQRVPEASSLFLDAESPQDGNTRAGRKLIDLLPTSHIVVGLSCTDIVDLVVAATRASYGIADELCSADTPEEARSIIERVESSW